MSTRFISFIRVNDYVPRRYSKVIPPRQPTEFPWTKLNIISNYYDGNRWFMDGSFHKLRINSVLDSIWCGVRSKYFKSRWRGGKELFDACAVCRSPQHVLCAWNMPAVLIPTDGKEQVDRCAVCRGVYSCQHPSRGNWTRPADLLQLYLNYEEMRRNC